MLVGELFLRVRRIVNDVDTPYRYSDAHLYEQLETSLYDLYRLRPDAFIDRLDAIPSYPQDTVTPTAAIDDPTVIALDNTFLQPIIYYIAGNLELIDDEFTVDGRAALLLKSFSNAIGRPMR